MHKLMNKRNFKIVRHYIIGIICMICYFLLENSDLIPELVEYSKRGRYKGFATFFITGLFKYGLLVIGVGIILIMTFLLIRKRISKDN